MTVRTVATHGASGAPRAIRLEYASFEARLVAATLDLLVLIIISAICVLVGSLIVLISSDFEQVDPSDAAINAFWVCVGAIAPAILLYFFISFAWKGQTVGDAVMQLMVIRSDGRPLGILGAVARVIGLLTYLAIILAGVVAAIFFQDSTIIAGIAIGAAIFFVLLGILWAAFDGRRRTLHDRMAGTIVVESADRQRNRAYGRSHHEDDGFRQRAHHPDTGTAMYAIVLGLLLFFLVGAISIRQLSDEPNANDLLQPLIAAITDLDTYLAETIPDLRRLAEVDVDQPVPLPGYPLDVTLSRDEAANATPAEIRQLILERSSAIVYESGSSAFDTTGEQSLSSFSSEGMLTFALDRLTSDTYDASTVAVIALGVLTLLAAAAAVFRNSGFGRIRTLGLAAIGGGVAGLLLSLGADWLIDRSWGGDPFSDEIGRVLSLAAEIPLRNYATVAGLGAAVVLVSVILGAISRSLESRATRHDDEIDYYAVDPHEPAEDVS